MSINDSRGGLSPQALEEQVQIIVHFLSTVHPSLVSDARFRPAVELRPIPRGTKTYMLSKSLNIWDLSDTSIEHLRAFLLRHNGQTTCLYYSVFTYDNNKKSVTSKGTLAKPGKITAAAAEYAEEIALDFDGIGLEEYAELVDRFEEMGLYALWVSTGHGYHAHILLDKPLSDKDLLRRFVYKFRSKGFSCDPACVDSARVMRLPGTFNNKCFQDKAYAEEQANPPECTIVQDVAARYSLDTITEKLDALPTVSEQDEHVYRSLCASSHDTAAAERIDAPNSVRDTGNMVTVRRVVYPHLSNYELPEAIDRMLAHTPHGYRNSVLGFLIKFFKTQYKMGKSNILEILELWSREACSPPYPPEEFKADFTRLYYHYNGLGYDTKLAQKFGNIDFQALIQLRKREIYIPHSFFHDFANLDSKAIRTYLVIKMLEHINEETSQEKIAEQLGISTRGLRDTIQCLSKSKHIYMTAGNRKQKIPNSYHTNRLNSTHEGFMPFSYNDIRAFVTELCEQGSGRTRSNGELSLYLFLRWKFYTGEIYMSQTNLGKNIGVAQNSISVIVSRLQSKHFLEVAKVPLGPCLESCVYTLLR